MNPVFHKGYTIFRNGTGPVFVAIHSGPNFENPNNRDENTDIISGLCWQRMGGALVVSNLSRKRTMGIDLNRGIPPKRLAINMWNKFQNESIDESTLHYKRNYGWVARNLKDYEERLKLYNSFWESLKNLGNMYVFVHRKYARIKNYPSVMDFVTFKGKGAKEEMVKEIIEKFNFQHSSFFRKIESDYINTVMLEQSKIYDRIINFFGSLEALNNSYKNGMKEDIAKIREHGTESLVRRMEKNFTKENYLNAARSAIRNMGHPKITVENIFTGEMAHGPNNQLVLGKDRVVIEIECNQFINYWYPEFASDIINNFLHEVKKTMETIGPVQLDIYNTIKRKTFLENIRE